MLHLTYSGGNKDQWSLEGPPKEVFTNDYPGKDPVKIDLEPGDEWRSISEKTCILVQVLKSQFS